jgi:3-keto-disaccharide hydrolase
MNWLSMALAVVMAGPMTWSFEKEALGKEPAGFEFATTKGAAVAPADAPRGADGRWVIQKEAENKVLAQVEGTTKNRFVMAVVKDSSYGDLRLSVRIKPTGGYQAAGLVWHYQDPKNYYVARTNAGEKNVSLYEVVNGARKGISPEEAFEIKSGVWHTLAVEQKGSSITVSVEGKKIIETENTTYPKAGRIGLWTKDDSTILFDDLNVEPLK